MMPEFLEMHYFCVRFTSSAQDPASGGIEASNENQKSCLCLDLFNSCNESLRDSETKQKLAHM